MRAHGEGLVDVPRRPNASPQAILRLVIAVAKAQVA